MFEKIHQWPAAHPRWALTLASLALLVPFLEKPFNIDDPLFIWVAKQIQSHPADPYGFNVSWGWTVFPMWNVTENPPLACYYVALVTAIFGWSELALHSAFLLPALAVILGTHRLARQFCGQPALAALITLLAPVFLVSSTTVMCDVMMLAFWIWGMVFWTEGLERNDFRKLAAAGLMIALAEMTKYYAASLLPLLAVYSLATRRPLKQWAPFLLIPFVIFCSYQYATQAIYGFNLFFRAVHYTSFSKNLFGVSKWNSGLIALAFTGGCVAPAVFFAPLLWRRRALGILTAVAVVLAFILFYNESLWKKYGAVSENAEVKIQMIFWAAGGLTVLALALADLWSRRDARSLLLLLWVIGTFIFAAFCNWMINARSILPLAPAAAILIARRLEQNKIARPCAIKFILAVSAVLALMATCSDYSYAAAVRRSAEQVREKYGRTTKTIWFQGHWGFQFYMQAFGAKPVDFKNTEMQPGDIVVRPSNNTNVLPLDPHNSTLLEIFNAGGPGWLATWNAAVGAGFYGSFQGPMPFGFGPVPPETVSVYWLTPGNSGRN